MMWWTYHLISRWGVGLNTLDQTSTSSGSITQIASDLCRARQKYPCTVRSIIRLQQILMGIPRQYSPPKRSTCELFFNEPLPNNPLGACHHNFPRLGSIPPPWRGWWRPTCLLGAHPCCTCARKLGGSVGGCTNFLPPRAGAWQSFVVPCILNTEWGAFWFDCSSSWKLLTAAALPCCCLEKYCSAMGTAPVSVQAHGCNQRRVKLILWPGGGGGCPAQFSVLKLLLLPHQQSHCHGALVPELQMSSGFWRKAGGHALGLSLIPKIAL